MKRVLVVSIMAVIVLSAVLYLNGRGKSPVYALGQVRVSRMVSPDGQYVAYPKVAFNEVNQVVTKLMVRSVEDDSVREVGEIVGHTSEEITWLGDDKLAVTTSVGFTNRPLEHRFAVMDMDGNRLPDIEIPLDFDYSHALFSPDGKQLLVLGDRQRWGLIPKGGYHVLDLNTGDTKTLPVYSADGLPAWSPDARKIASPVIPNGNQLWIFDVQSGEVEDTVADASNPDWSADGRYIACWLRNKKSIGLYDVEARQLRTLPETGNQSITIKCSLDGDWIAYIDSNTNELFVVSASGGKSRKIAGGLGLLGWRTITWASDDILYLKYKSEISKNDSNLVVKVVRADMKTGEVRVVDKWIESGSIPLGWSTAGSKG